MIRTLSTTRTGSVSDRHARTLLAAWAQEAAVDHHCHPLLRWPLGLEAADLRSCFTESRDPAQLEHVPQTAVYRAALRRLAAAFGCQPSESAILALRRMSEPTKYARELIQGSLTGLLLLDFGYAPPGAMTPTEHREALPVPQREVVRLETLAEGLIERCRRVDTWLDAVRSELEAAVRQGAVGVKTIAAYRASLRLAAPAAAATRDAYARLRRSPHPRLAGDELCHPLLRVAAEECARLGVPLQVHCGIGDADEDLGQASPLGLRPLLLDDHLDGLRLVLLHCYPYHREAAYLCSLHGGVFMDLSLAIPLAATDGARALAEALGMCPWSKLLYASDASRLPELYFIAAHLHREALAEAFSDLVEGRVLDLEEAVEAGRHVLAENARRLYRI
jgi:predicted TIM-barrel fold metal-dependent hydrolase